VWVDVVGGRSLVCRRVCVQTNLALEGTVNLVDLPVRVCRMQKNRGIEITFVQLEVMGNSVVLR
jgi:hypothetical protein